MPDYRAAARRAAKRYGVPPDVFVRQLQQESGFNPHAVSPAGARGIAQIMPATAKGWGVNPNDPLASINAAAKNMGRYIKQYGGSVRDALVAYNAGPGRVGGKLPAETQNYLKVILGGKGDVKASGSSGGKGGTRQPGTYKPGTLDIQGQFVPAQDVPDPATAAAMVLGGSGKRGLPKLGGGSRLKQMNYLLQSGQATKRLPADYTQTIKQTPTEATPGTTTGAGGQPKLGGGAAGAGNFKVTGANPGRLKPELLSYARKVAAIFGSTLTGDSGATHSKFTVNGNVSEHYTGNATDIPATGKRLLKMGRAALIAAGMPRDQAMKAQGGLYNVGNHQIIFLTNQGGNHYDHLHISTHAKR